MKGKCFRHAVLATLMGVALVAPARAAAQAARPPEPAVARSFDELRSRVSRGAAIVVTDSAGHEFQGTLRDLSDISLNLFADGKVHSFSAAGVVLVKQRRPDSLWNGLLIGAAVGSAPAVYWLLADPNECGNAICMSDLVTGVIPCATIGLVIDALVQKKVVLYRSASRSSRVDIAVRPIVTTRLKSVEMTISF